MSRIKTRTLVVGLLSALALAGCGNDAADPNVESERQARSEADATERHPVTAPQQSGAGQYAQDTASTPSDIASAPAQTGAGPRAIAPTGTMQGTSVARSEALARCGTLATAERAECESRVHQGYAMTDDDFAGDQTDASTVEDTMDDSGAGDDRF